MFSMIGEIRDEESGRHRRALSHEPPPRLFNAPHQRRSFSDSAAHGPSRCPTTWSPQRWRPLLRSGWCGASAPTVDSGTTPTLRWLRCWPGGRCAGCSSSAAWGCAACRGTGYRGRSGLFELLQMTEELKAAISHGLEAPRLREMAIASGMRTLREDGCDQGRGGHHHSRGGAAFHPGLKAAPSGLLDSRSSR